MVATSLLSILLVGFASPTTVTLSVNGVERQALVYAPTRGTGPAPIVFAFHGHGGGARQFSRIKLNELWPEAYVVYPQGLPTKTPNDPRGTKNGWDMSRTGSNKDIQFFDALLSKISSDSSIDPKRVFAMGHSNGGGFTYTLWDVRPKLFAGMGPSAANGLRTSYPISAFVYTSPNDPIVDPARQIACIERIVRNNGCGTPTKVDENLTQYPGPHPVWVWTHNDGHNFGRAGLGKMVEFFKSLSLGS